MTTKRKKSVVQAIHANNPSNVPSRSLRVAAFKENKKYLHQRRRLEAASDSHIQNNQRNQHERDNINMTTTTNNNNNNNNNNNGFKPRPKKDTKPGDPMNDNTKKVKGNNQRIRGNNCW